MNWDDLTQEQKDSGFYCPNYLALDIGQDELRELNRRRYEELTKILNDQKFATNNPDHV